MPKPDVFPLFKFATSPHLTVQMHGAVNCILPSALNLVFTPFPYVATGVDCQGLVAKLNPILGTEVPILNFAVGFVWMYVADDVCAPLMEARLIADISFCMFFLI